MKNRANKDKVIILHKCTNTKMLTRWIRANEAIEVSDLNDSLMAEDFVIYQANHYNKKRLGFNFYPVKYSDKTNHWLFGVLKLDKSDSISLYKGKRG